MQRVKQDCFFKKYIDYIQSFVALMKYPFLLFIH